MSCGVLVLRELITVVIRSKEAHAELYSSSTKVDEVDKGSRDLCRAVNPRSVELCLTHNPLFYQPSIRNGGLSRD